MIDGEAVPKSPSQGGIKSNICGTTDREMNCLHSKLVVWLLLNVTSMHVPDRWSGTGLMGMFSTWARCQFRQAFKRIPSCMLSVCMWKISDVQKEKEK